MQSCKQKTTGPQIPSREETGLEDGNDAVSRKSKTELPLNPMVTRSQDPELFWMHKYGPYYHLYSDVNVEVTEKNGKISKKVSPKASPESGVANAESGDVR